MENYLRIANIVRPHGVRGAIKLVPLTDDIHRFERLQEAYLETDGEYLPVSISHVSIQPNSVILTISGCETPEAAEKLRGTYLCVDRAHAVKLPPFTYFIADLIGCDTSDTDGNQYGKITDVLQTGANDVYVIGRGSRQIMVPALKKVLHSVDIVNKKIVFVSEVMKEVALFEN